MKEPINLLMVSSDSTVYTVSSYDNIKTSMTLQYGEEQWRDILKMWYEELLFTYQFDSTMKDFENMGVIEKKGQEEYEIADISNSLAFIRTRLVRELGNSAITNCNSRIEQRWKRLRKNAEKQEQESK
jgi:hypothetical protein